MNKLTYEKVIQLFDYDFETGNLIMNSKISQSNSSGTTGVWFDSSLGKYCAQIKVKYKSIWLGGFYSLELAIKARKEAEEEYFGEFAYKGVK